MKYKCVKKTEGQYTECVLITPTATRKRKQAIAHLLFLSFISVLLFRGEIGSSVIDRSINAPQLNHLIK